LTGLGLLAGRRTFGCGFTLDGAIAAITVTATTATTPAARIGVISTVG
jgi:hypothetical protein